MASLPNSEKYSEKNDVDILFKNIISEKKNDFERESLKSTSDLSDKVIDDANKYFLVKILSPEITNNEDKRRKHKDKLISIVKTFLVAQFIILSLLLFGTLTMIFVFHGLGNDLELSYIEIIIKFISVYITSVVVELIAMLKYIVSNVFDTSITGLVEIYRDKTKNQEQVD